MQNCFFVCSRGKNSKILDFVRYFLAFLIVCRRGKCKAFGFVRYFFVFSHRLPAGENAKLFVLYVIFSFSHRLPAGPTFHEKSSKIIGTVSRTLCIVLVIPSTSI